MFIPGCFIFNASLIPLNLFIIACLQTLDDYIPSFLSLFRFILVVWGINISFPWRVSMIYFFTLLTFQMITKYQQNIITFHMYVSMQTSASPSMVTTASKVLWIHVASGFKWSNDVVSRSCSTLPPVISKCFTGQGELQVSSAFFAGQPAR